MKEALDIQVKGIVQGVGFRPFVYRLAKKYLIDGWVLNATDGVFIHAEGETKLLDEFASVQIIKDGSSVAVVLAGMPVATNGTMLCYQYGGNSRVMAQGTFVTTVLAIASIPILAGFVGVVM